MKWLTSASNHQLHTKSTTQLKKDLIKPFLVLPITDSSSSYMGLKLGTNSLCDDLNMQTWPSAKVKKRKSKSLDRPGTATLERPRLLNENLINILDMSLITKELLQIIPNLCQTEFQQLSNSNKNNDGLRPAQKTSMIKRVKKSSKIELVPKQVINKIVNIKDANNNDNKKDLKTTINNLRKSKLFKTLNVTESENNMLLFGHSVDRVPEPCQTCGRSDQPERFHSHPVTPRSSSTDNNAIKVIIPTKKIVKIHNKSFHSKSESSSTPIKKGGSKSPYLTTMDFSKKKTTPRPLSTPRRPTILTCYLCGREFGSTSLRLHEAKCFERWERENAKLPPKLRREPPKKPNDYLSTEEWNEAAWKSSQSTLIACANCGRTFQPDRLEVHQRSCRSAKPTTPSSGWTSPGRNGPPTIECYICGRKFGTRSIGIHEPQCLKKWHAQNDLLPPNERLKPPVKADNSIVDIVTAPRINSASASTSRSSNNLTVDTEHNMGKRPESSTPKKPTKRTLACYLCGREYTPSSLKIHEPQCLKKWQNENDKLPRSQRREEPMKPDVVFTEKGQIDYAATNDESWKTHISQLIPCSKCSRTFFPDRVAVHENSCKG